MWVAGASLGALLAGCAASSKAGSSVAEREPPADAASGSRLVARHAIADGGARAFLHFLDEELDVPCAIVGRTDMPGSDVRCGPIPHGILYTEDACPGLTEDEALIQTAYAAFGSVWTSDFASFEEAGLRRLGDEIAPSPRNLDPRFGDCTFFDDGPIYEAGEPLDHEPFAAGTVVAVPWTDRLELRVFEGDDGSRALLHLVDVTTGAVCTPQVTRAGVRCGWEPRTSSPVVVGDFRDASCERLVVLEYSVPGVVSPVETADGENLGLHRFSAISETPSRLDADGDCVPLTDEEARTGRRTFFYADPYPEEAWGRIPRVRYGGPVTQLAPDLPPALSGIADARGEPVLEEPTRDRAHCRPQVVADALVCAGYAPGEALSAHFQASDCSGPTVHMRSPRRSAPGPVVYEHRGVGSPVQALLPVVALWDRGEQVDVQASRPWYARFDDGCRPADVLDYRGFEVRRSTLTAADFPALRLDPR